MRFEYTAKDPLGNELDGTLDATSRDSAVQLLRRDGLTVLTIEEAGDGSLFPRRVKRSDIIYLASQLAIMVDTGITLSEALRGIADQEENPTMKRTLLEIKSAVEAGDDFSLALSRYPKLFDKTFVALVRSSEETGQLSEMLEQIATYLSKEDENRGKVKAALAYPGIMMFLAIGVTLFLLTFIMPKFTPMFTSRGMDLPLTTRVLMWSSDSLLNYWWAWGLGGFGAVAAFVGFQRTEVGRQIIDYIKLHIPIMGPMFRKVTLSRCVSTLGTMVKSGVQMLDAIRLTADVSGNYYYEKSWHEVLDQITNGNRICDALKTNSLYPKTLIQMIGSGEETGQLDTVLLKVSAHYDREVENSLKTVTSMIEPLMITVMGGVVGTIGMSILLPIFKLSGGGH